MFINFFQTLFAASDGPGVVLVLPEFQPWMEDGVHASLLALTLENEVRSALFSMQGNKSPGPDGIQALFYQRNWSTVASTFVNFINDAISNSYFPPKLAEAQVVLIPKDERPETIQKF